MSAPETTSGLFYVKRPAPSLAVAGDRQALTITMTRFGKLRRSQSSADKLARKVQGRLYRYDGHEELVADYCDEPALLAAAQAEALAEAAEAHAIGLLAP